MKVSRSGFYDYVRKTVGHSEITDTLSEEALTAVEVFKASKSSYGSRRVSKALQRKGFLTGRYKARTLMKKYNLRVKSKRRYKITTNSKHQNSISSNLVQRNFNISVPNKLWLGDITYIWTKTGWLYLAVVMDACSRRIVGWAMNNRINDELVTSAFLMAAFSRKVDKGCIFHSDRGSQYASSRFRNQLVRFGFKQSMSRKGDCWDNAPMERFFSSLKRERISHCIFENQITAKDEIINYLLFYNYERLHSALNYISPMELEGAA